MSIQLAAKHLAAHGRGPDTTLVHMTPGEVASLQSLAQQHGGSLSINPQTGLPEAGFLSALLPMAAGAGLAAMGMPAGYAALSVGAASAATNGGDLRKGLMAGISAYGGAGMTESFMGAGLGTMGGAMGAPAAAPATVLEAPVGATSPYALTGSPAASSTAKYSLGESSSFLNKPLPSLVSTAPAQAVQAAAAATPAAQAAQQAAALDSMSMGQRFDALKAGATGTNAMNYIKANPFTSLGVATAAMTPDETSTPQKAADTDRGPRAKLQYYSGYGTSLPAPNMQGIEQTYNRPYYAAKGGVTRMATGGITSAPRNQQQLFADYLQRVSSSGAATTTPPTNKYEWWKNPNDPAPAAPAPAETAEEYAARMSLNARGGGGGMSAEQRAEQAADNDRPQPMLNGLSRNEYFSLSPEEQNAVRAQADMDNPKTAAFFNALKFVASPVKFLYDKLAPAPAASEMQKYIDAADAESRALTRDRAYEAYGNSIEGVTASDAAAAEAQRAQAEAANLARMQADTNPYGNYYDSPESSRLDASGYPLRESELRSFERGLSPATVQAVSLEDKAVPAPVTSAPIEGGAVPGATPLSTNKIVASEKLAADKPIGVTSGINFTPADAVAPYGAGEGNTVKNTIAALVEQQESAAKDYMQAGQTLGFGHPETVTLKAEADRLNALINVGYNRILGEQPAAETDKAREARVDAMIAGLPDARQVTPSDMGALDTGFNRVPTDNDPNANTFNGNGVYSAVGSALNPFPGGTNYGKEAAATKNIGTYTPGQFRGAYLPDVPGAISADTDDTTLSQFTNALYGGIAPPGYVGEGTQLAGVSYTGGIPDAGVLGGAPAPNMGNIRGSYGIGGVWTNKEGIPIRTGDGSLVMTGEGAEAMQRAVAESNAAANRTYGNSINSGPANDGRADPGGEGGTSYGRVAPGYTGGSEAAAGGLSTPYGFQHMANGGLSAMANPYDLGSYSDGGRLLKGPGDGVSDSIPATIGKGRPARLADGEFVIPARIVSEIGNGSTEAGARKLYAMMDRIQAGRKKSVGKGKVAVNSRADRHLPA